MMADWDGSERRASHELNDMKLEFCEFKAKVTEWMATTNEYRKALCTKMDTILDKVSKLPCDKRSGFYENVTRQMAFIWGVLILIVAAIIGEWIKR